MPIVGSGRAVRGPAVVPEAVEGPHVLVPVFGDGGDDTLDVAESLADERDADLLVMEPEVRPGGASGLLAPNVQVTVIERPPGGGPESIRETVRPGGSVGNVIERATTSDAVEAAVLRRDDDGAIHRFEMEQAAARADCDAVVLNDRGDLDRVGSVLFAVAGGPHSPLAAEVARGVAGAHDACIDVVHVVAPDADRHRRAMGEAYVAGARRLLSDYDRVDHWTLEDGEAAAAIAEQSRYYDVTVLGAPTSGLLRRFAFGSTPDAVRAEARGPVLTTRRPDTGGPAWFHSLG